MNTIFSGLLGSNAERQGGRVNEKKCPKKKTEEMKIEGGWQTADKQ